jgi:hypothetical protein
VPAYARLTVADGRIDRDASEHLLVGHRGTANPRQLVDVLVLLVAPRGLYRPLAEALLVEGELECAYGVTTSWGGLLVDSREWNESKFALDASIFSARLTSEAPALLADLAHAVTSHS